MEGTRMRQGEGGSAKEMRMNENKEVRKGQK